jgi:hypothetical protein
VFKETSKEWFINNFNTKDYWGCNLQKALSNHPNLAGDVPNDIIETGTYFGETAKIWSFQFNRVITIEASSELRAIAMEQNSGHQNIEYILGDTVATLRATLHLYKQRLVFFLNSHFGLYLEGELKAIKDCYKQKDPIIVVGDSQNLGYGSFPSVDGLHQLIMEINPKYVLEFLLGTGVCLCYLPNITT